MNHVYLVCYNNFIVHYKSKNNFMKELLVSSDPATLIKENDNKLTTEYYNIGLYSSINNAINILNKRKADDYDFYNKCSDEEKLNLVPREYYIYKYPLDSTNFYCNSLLDANPNKLIISEIVFT